MTSTTSSNIPTTIDNNKQQQQHNQCDFIEYRKTPLNACSIETLPPVEWKDDDDGSSRRIWPLMLGCYELDESTGKRHGKLDFYEISSVPEDRGKESLLRMGEPINIIGDENNNPLSGVLDGKWYPHHLTMDDDSNNDPSLIYATAHASGEILLHKVIINDREIKLVGRTECRDSSGLCLSLAWDLFNNNDDDDHAANSSCRIISSYSDGKVAIHETANISNNNNNEKIEFEQIYEWDAHTMFGVPAEVWCANFTSDKNVVMTGGDEGYLKIWDLRAALQTPMHTLKNTFEAGVTVISPHPRKEHVVAVGSYDETVALFDLRKVINTTMKPEPIYHSNSVGGGLWRIKWHPYDDDRLLLGAMHGGCRVVQLFDHHDNSTETKSELQQQQQFQIIQEFTNHKSMAYGADWLVSSDRKNNVTTGAVEVAASCSFYDRAFYLWEVVKS